MRNSTQVPRAHEDRGIAVLHALLRTLLLAALITGSACSGSPSHHELQIPSPSATPGADNELYSRVETTMLARGYRVYRGTDAMIKMAQYDLLFFAHPDVGDGRSVQVGGRSAMQDLFTPWTAKGPSDEAKRDVEALRAEVMRGDTSDTESARLPASSD